jgi:hypothetical protein
MAAVLLKALFKFVRLLKSYENLDAILAAFDTL